MYQISKSRDGKVLEVTTSDNPKAELSTKIQRVPLKLRPNWSELTDTQGIFFDIGGLTYWVHKLQTNQ